SSVSTAAMMTQRAAWKPREKLTAPEKNRSPLADGACDSFRTTYSRPRPPPRQQDSEGRPSPTPIVDDPDFAPVSLDQCAGDGEPHAAPPIARRKERIKHPACYAPGNAGPVVRDDQFTEVLTRARYYADDWSPSALKPL